MSGARTTCSREAIAGDTRKLTTQRVGSFTAVTTTAPIGCGPRAARRHNSNRPTPFTLYQILSIVVTPTNRPVRPGRSSVWVDTARSLPEVCSEHGGLPSVARLSIYQGALTRHRDGVREPP